MIVKRVILMSSCAILLMANNGGCLDQQQSDPAAQRQAVATMQAMDNADRSTGMPRIVNFAQRKLLKNAYEDMDQTTLTYVYSQALDGKFVCLGQALGYGVSLGTQFTAPHRPEYHADTSGGNIMIEQPEPTGLYSPDSGAATIVDLINPKNGEAHTAVVEPNIVTVPFELPNTAVEVPCPGDVDPAKVVDVKETSVVAQLGTK